MHSCSANTHCCLEQVLTSLPDGHADYVCHDRVMRAHKNIVLVQTTCPRLHITRSVPGLSAPPLEDRVPLPDGECPCLPRIQRVRARSVWPIPGAKSDQPSWSA